ncbi:MAG: 30S ribosomal protein THX [Verrucomicrobiota bacterium]
MGKGDKRTKRGKMIRGTKGNSRLRASKKIKAEVAEKPAAKVAPAPAEKKTKPKPAPKAEAKPAAKAKAKAAPAPTEKEVE